MVKGVFVALLKSIQRKHSRSNLDDFSHSRALIKFNSKSVLDINNYLYTGVLQFTFEKPKKLKLDRVTKFKQLGNIESPPRTLQTGLSDHEMCTEGTQLQC